MDDLLFRNIPAEGFDPTATMDRASNPTPSRATTPSTPLQDDITTFSLESQLANLGASAESAVPTLSSFTGDARLSNPTSTIHPVTAPVTPQVAEFDTNPNQQPAERSERASNPTPTRRNDTPTQPIPDVTVSPIPVQVGDAYSRASNPTPTRRTVDAPIPDTGSSPSFSEAVGLSLDNRPSNPTPRRRVSNTASPSSPIIADSQMSGTITDEALSRASNPTPTRRRLSSQPQFLGELPQSVEPLALSGTSTSFSVPVSSDSRASNPTPTRRRGMTDQAANNGSDVFDDPSSRLSNPTSSNRR